MLLTHLGLIPVTTKCFYIGFKVVGIFSMRICHSKKFGCQCTHNTDNDAVKRSCTGHQGIK